MLNAEREIIMRTKGKGKWNKAKLIRSILLLCIVLFMANMAVSFLKYPEQYITTWKYQLRNDLECGNEKALEYYNENYVANGKRLFGNRYIAADYEVR